MTVPLMVLAAFAAFAGFLNAEPLKESLHLAPLGDAHRAHLPIVRLKPPRHPERNLGGLARRSANGDASPRLDH